MDRLTTAIETLGLKEEQRQGWVLREVTDPESVADHSWGTAMLTLIYGPEQNIDVGKAVQIAIVHDLAEVETGDIITRADAADADQPDRDEKQRKEQDAIERITDSLGEDRIKTLWRDYENRQSPEAIFVKDMDLVEMCVQALRYEQEQRYDPSSTDGEPFDDLEEFFISAEERVRTKKGKQLVADLKQRYESINEGS